MKFAKIILYLFPIAFTLNVCDCGDPLIQKGWELNRQGIELLSSNPE